MKKRVLLWVDLFAPYVGGVEVLAARYVRAMSRRDFEFVIVTRGEGAAVEEDDFEGVPVYRLNVRAAVESGDPRQMLQLRRKVGAIAADFQPHLAHIYHIGMGAMLFDALRQTPLLLTLHAHLPPEHSRPRTALATLLESVDFITCCSQSVLSALHESLPAFTSRSRAILNALEVPGLAPSPLPFAPPGVLALGRLIEAKGFDTAIDVLARLTAEFPDLHLTIAGNGPHLPALIRQAETLGVRERVAFPGWVAPDEVPALINRHTLTIMPSRNCEPFGLVALQTAQMARPIVASRDGGLPEVVSDGVTGILAAPGDASAFADAVRGLLSQPERAVAMGDAAREWALTHFSWDAHLDAYEELMDRLIAGSTNKRTHEN